MSYTPESQILEPALAKLAEAAADVRERMMNRVREGGWSEEHAKELRDWAARLIELEADIYRFKGTVR